MGLIKFALSGNYLHFIKEINILSKKINKPSFILFVDMIFSTILVGSGLSDYLNYRFYKKTFKEKKEYVTIGYQAKFYKKVCSLKYADFFSNKINFNKNFKKYTKRDFFETSQGLESLSKFVLKHKNFVIKPIVGLGGTDVSEVNFNEIGNLGKFYKKLKDKGFFLEEKIKQHSEWARLSPRSINTIRVMTRIIKGRPDLFFAVARVGSGKFLTDNFHKGGLAILVDLNTGTLKGNGITKNLQKYEVSPITGVKFDSFKIPFWEETKKIVIDAAFVNTKVAVVGWDIAISQNGPIIVEGNRGPGFDIVQVVLGRGAKYMLDIINLKEFER
ncbi:MAG: hypothetical protein LBI55_01770 [Oscillospiraceae bacterium]|nr:hypothetical protein [Oscillospiraceae bacterium]